MALGAPSAAAVVSCAAPRATAPYSDSIQRAVTPARISGASRLLTSRSGPTLAAANRYLAPLLLATQRRQVPLTPSGFYYVPLSFGFSSYGPAVFALHVADGSEIITRHVGGPSLTFYVGNGRERYGSCTERLRPARLADGYLPIVQTSYVDANGVKYRQESFVGRAYGARSVVSFVKLEIDASTARSGATVRLVPWKLLAHSAPDRLAYRGSARLIVSDGAEFVDGVVRYRVARGDEATVYAEWLNGPSEAKTLHADAPTYDAARTTVVNYWTARLTSGMQFDVPEPAVSNAALGVLEQVLAFGWRYSVGNPYEELSFAEALDSAEVAAEYGFPNVAKSILQVSLDRLRKKPKRFTAFRAGHLLSTAALYYRLTRDRSFIQLETPELARLVRQIREPPGRARAGARPPSPRAAVVRHSRTTSTASTVRSQPGRGCSRSTACGASPAIAPPRRRRGALGLSIGSALRSGLRKASPAPARRLAVRA